MAASHMHVYTPAERARIEVHALLSRQATIERAHVCVCASRMLTHSAWRTLTSRRLRATVSGNWAEMSLRDLICIQPFQDRDLRGYMTGAWQ